MKRQDLNAVPRRLRRVACALALIGGWCAAGAPAAAIEIQCIEASRYKYLYQLFNNSPQRLAAYLKVDADKLPDGEKCRAVIITGSIDSASMSKKARSQSDSIKLLQAIEQNGGWLATLYLASGGGNVGMGMEIAQLTRMFWLKTVSLNEKEFPYYPDFGLMHVERPQPPSRQKSESAKTDGGKRSDRLSDMRPPEPVRELATGWRNYQKVAPYRVNSPKAGRCASACSFLHVAGIDRSGVVYVHRPRFGARTTDGKRDKTKRIDTDRTMTDTLEGMQRSEAGIIAFYQQMDAGEAIVRQFERTSSATVEPSLAARFPRYVADYLREKCGGDAVALERSEARGLAVLGKRSDETERIQKTLNQIQSKRAQVETCIAISHEAERLTQFAKYCPGGRCDRKAIASAVGSKKKALRARE